MLSNIQGHLRSFHGFSSNFKDTKRGVSTQFGLGVPELNKHALELGCRGHNKEYGEVWDKF